MSSGNLDSQVASLQASFEALQLQVESLRAEVSTLQERLSTVESRTFAEDFVVVSEVATPGTAAGSEAGYRVGSQREAIAAEVGQWIRRALNGQRRGLSGREKISQGSRYYLVFKDFDCGVHNPPILFTSWSNCKTRVTRSGQSGDSVYVGLPTQEEARIVCRAAGCSTPAALTHG